MYLCVRDHIFEMCTWAPSYLLLQRDSALTRQHYAEVFLNNYDQDEKRRIQRMGILIGQADYDSDERAKLNARLKEFRQRSDPVAAIALADVHRTQGRAEKEKQAGQENVQNAAEKRRQQAKDAAQV